MTDYIKKSDALSLLKSDWIINSTQIEYLPTHAPYKEVLEKIEKMKEWYKYHDDGDEVDGFDALNTLREWIISKQ